MSHFNQPALFQPLKLNDSLTVQNRIGVAPMCMYAASTPSNTPTHFHLIHYGLLAVRGPGLIILESTSVSPNAGLSTHDLGLWNDAQAHAMKPIVEFIREQRHVCCIQLNHGGRKVGEGKGLGGAVENHFVNHCVAPSGIAFSEKHTVPRELSVEEIREIVRDFGDAAERAVKVCGFDAVEVHAGNGCLIHQFLSGLTNKREDEYGGRFENRIRLAMEVIGEVKARVEGAPVFVKLALCDNCDDEGSWTPEEALRLADELVKIGVAVIDVTSGGVVEHGTSRYLLNEDKSLPSQVPLARKLKKHVGDRCLVACSGGLDRDVEMLNQFVNNGEFDLALFGKGFLRDTGLTWTIAEKLGAKVNKTTQYECAFD
ncbi:NADPH dehydrogenase afvA [Candida viswanathii]|uniref:NADPH dehydrogenase afvA n=1 Tax=Candida viswanathii TaxID=5486 RepID=A0A367XQX0_9ASCO|nr:NADPH dehydrogenase afvA [Candida viswanathii]